MKLTVVEKANIIIRITLLKLNSCCGMFKCINEVLFNKMLNYPTSRKQNTNDN